MKFKIVDGDNYWSKYEDFISLYNESSLTCVQIRETLELTSNKYRQYKERGLEENKLTKWGFRSKGTKR